MPTGRTSIQVEKTWDATKESKNRSHLNLGRLIVQSVDFVKVVKHAPEGSDFVFEETSLNWEYSRYYFQNAINAIGFIEWKIQYRGSSYEYDC